MKNIIKWILRGMQLPSDSGWFCPICGTKNADSADKCQVCGK